MSTHPEGTAPDNHNAVTGNPVTDGTPVAGTPVSDTTGTAADAPPAPPTAPPTAPPSVASPAAPYAATPYAANPYTPGPGYTPGAPGAGTPGVGFPGAPRQAGTDGLSIAALVTGLLSLGIVPIVLGVVSLARIKRSGAAGRGMAIAGIVLGALGMVAWAVLIVLGVAAVSSEEFQDSFEQGFEESFEESYQEGLGESAGGLDGAGATEEPVDEPVDATAGSVTVGQCVAIPAEGEIDITTLAPLDCAAPHDAEFFALQDVPDGDYPGEDAMLASGNDFCLAEFGTYLGIDYTDSVYDFGYFYPSVKSWAFGDRQIACYAASVDGSPLTVSLQGIAE